MKQKFKYIGYDETKITVEVSIESSFHVLTKDEQIKLRKRLENYTHQMLRDHGYDVSEIKKVR